jgi:hypothetical protein
VRRPAPSLLPRAPLGPGELIELIVGLWRRQVDRLRGAEGSWVTLSAPPGGNVAVEIGVPEPSSAPATISTGADVCPPPLWPLFRFQGHSASLGNGGRKAVLLVYEIVYK